MHQIPFNEKLQAHLTRIFQQYNVQQLPTNFSNYFGAGPTLASNFSRLSNELNPHRLNLNCYYCTIAALTNRTVLDMVAETEIMQQDTATLDEIMYLFHEAGVSAAMMRFYDYTLSPQQLWAQTYDYLDRALAAYEAMGLAWTRQPEIDKNGLFSPATGHMTVVAKDGNGMIAVLDYQSGNLEVISREHPPEGAWHQHYSLFQQYALQATQSWQDAYDFICSQYIRHLSWRGVLIADKNNPQSIQLYHMPTENSIVAEINRQAVILERNSDPRGTDTDSPIMICPVR